MFACLQDLAGEISWNYFDRKVQLQLCFQEICLETEFVVGIFLL